MKPGPTALARLAGPPAPRRVDPRCPHVVDHRAVAPIALAGRLVVTYVDQGIDEDAGDPHELGLLDLAAPGRGVRRVTRNLANEAEVEIAPDGRSFLYTVRAKLDGFGERSEIWRRRIDGTRPERLVGGGSVGVPAWLAPASDRFVFIRWGRDEDAQLRTYDVPGRREAAYLGHLAGAADPEVSDDGRRVTFKRAEDGDRDRQPGIWVADADGRNLRRLTRGWSDHDPVFARDGRTIYFERYYGPGDWFEASQERGVPAHNRWGVVAVDVASGRERVVIPHDPCGRHFWWLPTVAPDGRSLMVAHVDVWGEDRGQPWADLWVVAPDGGRPQRVPGSAWCYFFDWTR